MILHFGSSLKTRIAVVAGLLLLAGITLISLFATKILHDDMQDLVSQQQLTAANYIARDIDGKITLRRESLKRVALNMPPALFTNPAALQIWLEDRKAIHTLFPIGLMVIPPDGGPTLADTPHLKTRPKSFTDRDWFIDVIASRETVVSKPLIARATQEPALVVAVPIFDPQNNLLGILAGVTPLATPGFLDLIQGVRPGTQGSYQLISPRHRIYALTSEKSTAVTPLPDTGKDPIIDQAINGMRGIRIITNAAGEEELVAIVGVPQPRWLLIARQPGKEAFATVANTLRNLLLITALLALPIVVMLLAALSRLLQPLATLAGELHSMAEGTRPMHPVEARSADEVADVANSFNRLQGKLQEQEYRLAEMAHHDVLTGLPNRLLLTDRLENGLKQMPRIQHSMAVLFLDLDGFKTVNDNHGHQVGDLLLIEIARRLSDSVRTADTVGRLGGDEFLIILSPADNPLEAAERVAETCLHALAQPIIIGDLALTVTTSIGIVICEKQQAESVTASQLMSQADVAMYRAKAAGRNRYAVYAAPSLPANNKNV
ncbi:sensor domain-containing diguanylate cyclase [Quatrionicoccus australiensis]|uniref:sensor domain-containing diguanylate cyclase n=1 Tax=Quatrionicoccus australiensis TaxID=138118 RepID=UPI001CFA0B53|nr:GGDEF domain-containing protein [Quatrionicoccus australiensis]MCB4360601.1 GGDEF domain-containing protein [Quatrionicoccus australiensis]